LPIVRTDYGTFKTATRCYKTRGRLSRDSQLKVDTALAMFERHVDAEALLGVLNVARTDVVTPLMFEYDLLDRARSSKRHIVLPEGSEDRILRAAATLLKRSVVDLTILGDESSIRTRAGELGLDIGDAAIISPSDPTYVERFAAEYAEARANKGATLDSARDIVQDVSYFGTMMVRAGLADGMVSGAAHTTAHTISPAFQVIKTPPGVSIVSSVFFMCLSDRVLVYGDCAVNADPTAEQLADIAISSAETARQFRVEPRIAMLSYSTGESGTGSDVDGPMQYDAAVEPSVAASKAPNSPVAGRATVLVFPDLNTGNNTYKAVQRSAGAVAVGPVLQGLRKPVNDLSRGALVQDIVNTVAITAIQAQELNPEGIA
jgi:phosphate acetyltransferase